jgi:soluble lytic murein transglycosylase-like protein
MTADWRNEQQGPIWVPILNLTENRIGLPVDLLARIAYEESHYRDDVIRGTYPSVVGALGIMQLMPKFFTTVRVPIPFNDVDVTNQIDEAGHFLAGMYQATHDWDLAIAAYNAGLGNVRKYGGIPPFPETQKYVADITADVPGLV